MNKKNFRHYSIGIPQIDEEHWELVKCVNKIECAINDEEEFKAKKALDTFFIAFEKHCLSEETLMKECEFIYLTAHIAHHTEELRKLKTYVDVVRDNLLYLNATEIRNIIMNHILQQDSQLLLSYSKKNLESKTDDNI